MDTSQPGSQSEHRPSSFLQVPTREGGIAGFLVSFKGMGRIMDRFAESAGRTRQWLSH